MNPINIYKTGKYFEQHPDLHISDSLAKVQQISKLVEGYIFYPNTQFKILDIGGGAGVICNEFLKSLYDKGIQNIKVDAVDPSKQSLEEQKTNNLNIENIFVSNIEDFYSTDIYDCALLIDVIEHVDSTKDSILTIASCCSVLIANVPLELSMNDLLRNFFSRGRYFMHQEQVLGHIRRYNWYSARKQFEQYFRCKKCLFWPYANHLLNRYKKNEIKLSKIRRLECYISIFVHFLLPFLSPFLLQGSCFLLLENKNDIAKSINL